ncbi:MAG: hypothetical protein U0840_17445 [Gemmataceae bacterium]
MKTGPALAVVLLPFALLASCGCLGPQAVRHTRARYNEAVHATGDEELLLNFVRLRYGEGVSFLPITAVNAQFEFDTGAQYIGGISEDKAHSLGTGRVGFADRPTLSFDPRRSEALTKALLSRLDLETIDLLDAAGWDLGRLLRLVIESINGVGNALQAGGPTPATAPEFAEYQQVAGLMQRLYEQRLTILGVEQREADVPASVPFTSVDGQTLVTIQKSGYGVRSLSEKGYVLTERKAVKGVRIHPEAVPSPEFAEITRILHLTPGLSFYEIEMAPGGQVRATATDALQPRLIVSTRSLLEIMYFMSHAISVPEEHLTAGLVTVTLNPDGTAFDWGQVTGDLFRILVCKHRPKQAAVTVQYRGYWFYIDDADVASKTTLALFRELTRLRKVGAAEGQPLLTLPVGR